MVIEDGVLVKVKDSEIVNGTVEIPEGVTRIGERALQEQKNKHY